jgi:D-arabinose 1-dehydrogenase-like Zn-dependent alcohol dehydrogenase
MARMKTVQVAKAGGTFEVVQRDVPEPGPGEIRVKVEACGLCHGDSLAKEGHWPGIQYPRVPGHEIAGVVDAVGAGPAVWKKGQRVGVGWAGGHCGLCGSCRRGNFLACKSGRITGIHFDGGYGEYVLAPSVAVAALPDEISFAEAAPILCAGVTTFNALRHTGARAGELVAVQGIGGLGHMGVQFANKMGFKTVAISKGAEKEALARKLGAHVYIDDSKGTAAAELQRLGGARVILATAPHSPSITALVDGLGLDGELMVVSGAPAPIQVSPLQLIPGRRAIRGWASGSAADSEDTLNFCALTGIRPLVETFRRDEASKAYERMMSNAARFRAVLVA